MQNTELLLTNALSSLSAALENISSKCTPECPENCTEIAHPDSEPDCEGAADEILEAQRRIQEFLNARAQVQPLPPAEDRISREILIRKTVNAYRNFVGRWDLETVREWAEFIFAENLIAMTTRQIQEELDTINEETSGDHQDASQLSA